MLSLADGQIVKVEFDIVVFKTWVNTVGDVVGQSEGQQLWNIPFETDLSSWLSPSPGAIEGLLWRLAGFGTMTLASE